jgi:uncharacterized membrane protein
MSAQQGAVHHGAGEQDTAFGLAANLAAAISYILPIIGLIVLFVEDDNEFLRFNAAQAVAFGFGLFIIRSAVGFTLALLPDVIALVGGLLMAVINLIIFGGFIFLAYKAYSEEVVELPVFADIARSITDAV